MNTTVIVLGVIIILLIYVLYYFIEPLLQFEFQRELRQPQPPLTSIQKPTNSRYGYTLWLYVNTWDNNVEKTIFSRDNNMNCTLIKLVPF